jgi:hypothetical protein
VVVANVYNSSKKHLKFAIIRVSNVSRVFERLRRLVLTRVTGSFPPRFEAPKLDPGGCVLEAPSEARLNFWKHALGLLSTIPVISEASPSEVRFQISGACFRGRFIGASEEGSHASKGE